MLILFFGFVQASVVKPGVLNLFLSYCFFKISSKRRFSNQAFLNSGSKLSWYWSNLKKTHFLVYFNRATICVLMLWPECSFRNDFTPLWQKPLLSIFQAVNLLLNQPALQPHFTLISPHYSKRNFKSVSRATFPQWVQSCMIRVFY